VPFFPSIATGLDHSLASIVSVSVLLVA
jgi:hypothetical protein